MGRHVRLPIFTMKRSCVNWGGPVRNRRSNPEGRKRALAAIARFVQMARAMEVPKLTAVATAAVRDADDGEEFCLDVLNQTGQHITIVNGEEEARLSA